jgi:hypothetical protein
MPDQVLATSKPGRNQALTLTTAPFRIRPPSPSVSTPMGRATMVMTGQITALTIPINAAVPSAVRKSRR